VDATLIEAERRVAIEKAKEAGKPDAMLEKIADGTVQKFLKEVTLLSQNFVKDDKVTIEQLLKSKGASVASFTMYTVGEGIEKIVTDFACRSSSAEVVKIIVQEIFQLAQCCKLQNDDIQGELGIIVLHN
jgi:elongation factor Ts